MSLKTDYKITKAEQKEIAKMIEEKLFKSFKVEARKQSLYAVDHLVGARSDNDSGSMAISGGRIRVSVLQTKKMLGKVRKTKII